MRKRWLWIPLAVCALIAVCGYWQVITLSVFWCGRVGAFPTIYPLTAFALLQFGLYLSVAASPRHRHAYTASQVVVLPFLVLALIQAFLPYPLAAIVLAAAGVLPVAIARSRGWAWTRRAPFTACGVALLTSLGVMGTIVQIPLSMPATIVTGPVLVAAVLAALIAAVIVLWHLERSVGQGIGRQDLLPMLPLSLLLLAVLRAKFPDQSYDAYLYKATLPMQMADWRSGDMPIMNAMMVGTTFQEMLNAALIMVTRDFLPPLISTIAFLCLFFISPLAFATQVGAPGKERAIAAFAASMAFTVTEAVIAQGTSYQEPLMLLLLTASLLPGMMWPAFLAMATMVKINAGFLAPLIVMLQCQRNWRSAIGWPTMAVAVLAALLVVGPQFRRNLVFSGRLLGQTELLANFTDPPGPHQLMVAGASHFDGPVRGGPLNNAMQSACNMLLQSIVCPTAYHGSEVQGFQVFPASRAPLFAVVASLVLLIAALARQTNAGIALLSVALYLLCYLLILVYMSEGRYFLPASFGFAVLLMVNRAGFADLLFGAAEFRRGTLALTGLAVLVIGSDLVPGLFNNVSWFCQRSLFTPAKAEGLTTARTPTEAFLMRLASDYRGGCPPPGLPPVILGQHDKLNAPYLGVQQSHFYLTHAMNERFYAADPSRRDRLAWAVLALAYVDPNVPSQILGSAAKDFAPCFADGDTHVLCSKELAPAGRHCAESLFPGSAAPAAR